MCEPLREKKANIVAYACYGKNHDTTRNKIVGKPLQIFEFHNVKSALEWMIQIHEEKIEELIKKCKNQAMSYDMMNWVNAYVHRINIEYESITILEAGLEDVI